MIEPNLHMIKDADVIIKKISGMVSSAAKENKSKIEIPISEVHFLIDSIKYAYAVGAIDSAMDSSLLKKSCVFSEYFRKKYNYSL